MSDPLPSDAYPRPGLLRQAAAGAWHLPAAIAFLLRRPRLWPVAAIPAALVAFSVVAGVALGIFAFSPLDSLLTPEPGRLPHWLGFALTVAIAVNAVVSGALLGLFLGLGLSAPPLEWLSRQVEAMLTGRAVDAPSGLMGELLRSFRGSLYLGVAAPIGVLLGLIPLFGPILALSWGAHAAAFQQTDGTLIRRGMGYAARRAWHRRYRNESFGLGIASLLMLPFSFAIAAPVLTVGATRLVLELEGADEPQ